MRLLFAARLPEATCLKVEASENAWPGFEGATGKRADGLLPEAWLLQDVFYFEDKQLYLQGVVTPLPEGAFSVTLIDAGAQAAERSNQEINAFAYKASHDLQEPLRKINTFGARLLDSSKDRLRDDEMQFLERMRAAAMRMQNMLDGLLAYSRAANLPEPHPEDTLEAAIGAAWAELNRDRQKRQLIWPDQPLPGASAFAAALEPVFKILFENAAMFCDPERSLTIALNWHSDEEGLHLSVRDNGIGFEQAQAERIFGLFERLNGISAYPGVGMGLAVARKRMHALGGAIRAEGRPGEGATFFLDLPVPPAHNA